jgi:hypothetical protein
MVIHLYLSIEQFFCIHVLESQMYVDALGLKEGITLRDH